MKADGILINNRCGSDQIPATIIQ